MATLLKQSTAVNIKLGPFVDEGDGVTPLTSLTISQADVRLAKNDGNWTQKNDSSAASHEENGWYEVALNTTDTNTLGTLIVAVSESGALPVWREFQVVPANVYDAMVAGSDNLEVDTTQWGGTAVASANVLIDGAITAAKIASNAITDSKIASGALTAAKFASGAFDAVWSVTTRLLTAGTNIVLAKGTGVTGFNDLSQADVRTAVGLASANLDSQLAAQDTGAVSSAVWSFANRTVTNVTGFSDTGVNDRLARILADTDTGLKDEIAALDTGLRALITASAGGDAPDTGAIASAVWGFSTRVLTAGTNISLAKGSGITGFNDLSQADVRTAVGLASANLDTQLAARDTGAIAAAVWSKDARSLTSFNHDTGVAHATWNSASRTVTDVTGFSDTGVNDRLSKIGGDADTGLRDAISDARYVDTGPTADLAALRSGVNVTSFADTGINDRLSWIQSDVDTGLRDYIVDNAGNVVAIRGDTGAASRLQKLAGNQLKEDGTFDTGTGQVTNTFNVQANVTLDTGTPINVQVDIPAIAAGVWSAGSRTLTDIDTGVITSGVWSASTRTLTSFSHDTGVAHTMWSSATRTLTNYHDTGIDQDLTRIISRVAEADTGLKDAIADLDTGLRGAVSAVSSSVPDTGAVANAVWAKDARTLTSFGHDTGVSHTVWNAAARTLTNYHDTGIDQDVARVAARVAEADTGLRSAISGIQGGGADTGAIVNAVWGAQRSAHADTGTFGEHLGGDLGGGTASVDTGAIADAVWGKDSRTLTSINDTGLNQRLDVIRSDTDTGLRSAILASAYVDTGPTADLAALRSGVNVTSFADTGVNSRLTRIQAEADTGLRSAIQSAAYSDTGLRDALADLDTGLRDYITDAVPTASITAIKNQTDKLMFDTGGELQVDIRKVNNVTVTGTGDTGAGDTWRPA